MANFHHNRNRRGHKNHGPEQRENKEAREVKESREQKDSRENKPAYDQQAAREMYRERRDNRDNRDNQNISTFTLGEKELEGKNAQFHYDKGWYSIIDIVDEEKNVVYKSRNAQEAYTKWNVYIGRKKERPQRAEKTE